VSLPSAIVAITAASQGDPATFLTFDVLRARLAALEPAPTERGTLEAVIRRTGKAHLREELSEAHITPDKGLPSDAWSRRPRLLRKAEAQLAVMEAPIARLIANGQPFGLFGDNLFVDLDLSAKNLPIGTTIAIGTAKLEVTPKPHNGCKKFKARFGDDALALVCDIGLRPRNLRGVYFCVREAGTIRLGDTIEILARP
jgi:hypothetical protein